MFVNKYWIASSRYILLCCKCITAWTTDLFVIKLYSRSWIKLSLIYNLQLICTFYYISLYLFVGLGWKLRSWYKLQSVWANLTDNFQILCRWVSLLSWFVSGLRVFFKHSGSELDSIKQMFTMHDYFTVATFRLENYSRHMWMPACLLCV